MFRMSNSLDNFTLSASIDQAPPGCLQISRGLEVSVTSTHTSDCTLAHNTKFQLIKPLAELLSAAYLMGFMLFPFWELAFLGLSNATKMPSSNEIPASRLLRRLSTFGHLQECAVKVSHQENTYL